MCSLRRPPIRKQPVKQPADLAHEHRVGKFTDRPLAAPAAERVTLLGGEPQNPRDAGGDGLDVRRINRHASLAIDNRVRAAAVGARKHRSPASGRLDIHHPEALAEDLVTPNLQPAGKGEEVAGGVELPQPVTGDSAAEVDRVSDAESGSPPLEISKQGALPNDAKRHGQARLPPPQQGRRFEQLVIAFIFGAWVVPADGEHRTSLDLPRMTAGSYSGPKSSATVRAV